MGLQTSGAISLNQIHVEAGGSSGTQASINDSDIRALIGKASGAQMSFSEWYGASSNWTTNLTMGNFKNIVYGYAAGAYGSLSDTTIDTFGNRTLAHVFWNTTSVGITITGAPNSGWTRVKIHNTNFYRSQANSFNSNVGQWMWNTTTNPFGTTTAGAVRLITFVI